MSDFTEAELAYLAGQLLGRLATVGGRGEPHVVPVGFRHNAELDTIDIGGHGITGSKKYRDVARNGRVAFVVDALASVDSWRVRGIEARGTAAVLPVGGEEVGPGFDREVIRIAPHRIVGWGIEDADFVRSRGRTVR